MHSISLFYVMKHQIHQIKINCFYGRDMLTKKGEICDNFLKFVHRKSGLTGWDLVKAVVDTLNELGLDLKNCWGQCYDGAGAVSGVVNGLFALIVKEHENALYTHCAIHRFNLAIRTS